MESLNTRLWNSTDLDEIRQLIKDGVDVNFKNYQGFPLTLSHCSVEKLTILLENKADVNPQTPYFKKYPVHDLQDLEKLKVFIKFGTNLNALDPRRRTGLICSLINNEFDKAKLLIESGADVNIADDITYTPLMYSKYPEVTKALIKAGARVNDANRIGATALMIIGNSEITKILLEAGARLNDIDEDHYNALMYSDSIGKTKILLEARNGRININQQGLNGKTSLMIATGIDHRRLLIEYGADTNLRDNDGDSFLFYCDDDEKNLFKHFVKELPSSAKESDHDRSI